MKPECQESWYGPTNRYLATLNDAQQDAIFAAFIDSKKILDEPSGVKEITEALKVNINTISKQIDFAKALKWANQNGQLDVDTTTAVAPPAGSSPETTFSRQQCYELSCYAMLIKIVSPIVGLMCKVISGSVGNDFKEPDTARILEDSEYVKMPPYIKLESYCNALADKRKANMSTAVAYKMPTNVLGYYILSLAIVRRLVPAAIKGSNQGILSFCYNFIQAKLDKLRNGYSDKHATSGGDDNDSFLDHYRISDEMSICIKACTQAYLSDTSRLAKDVGVGHLAKDCIALKNYLEQCSYEVTDVHTPFLGIVLDKAVHRWIVDAVNRDAKLSAIAVTAVWLKDNGYEDIAAILSVNRKMKVLNNMRLSADGPVISKLPPEVEEKLLARYPFLSDGNKQQVPGIVLIDKVVKFVAAHDWEVIAQSNIDLSKLRTSVATLLINAR